MGKNITIDMTGYTDSEADDFVVEEDAPLAVGTDVDPDVVDENIDPADRLPKQARRNVNGSVSLPLMFPRSVKSKNTDGKVRETHFAELVLHRLTGADQRAIAATSDEMMTVVALSRSTRINQSVMNALFDKLDLADITAAGQVLNHFLASGPKTGK